MHLCNKNIGKINARGTRFQAKLNDIYFIQSITKLAAMHKIVLKEGFLVAKIL